MGWDWTFTLMPYGPRWRAHRRTMHQYFTPNASLDYLAIQEQQLLKFLRGLLVQPDNFLNLIHL